MFAPDQSYYYHYINKQRKKRKNSQLFLKEGSLSGRGDELIQCDSGEEQTWAAGELGHLGETLL